jgi:Spy/CpxP family protein refolding chaperone
MKQTTYLGIVITALVLLNVGTLAFVLFSKPSEPPPPFPLPPGAGHPQFDRMIVETLQLNYAQRQQFEMMKQEHHESMMKLDREYNEMLKDYLGLLKNVPVDQTTKDSLERKLSQIQVQKASITLDHFTKLRAICTPEQQSRFDSLIPELTRVIAPPQNMPPPPPRN